MQPTSSPARTVDAIAIRRFFESTDVKMKVGQSDTLAIALVLLLEMGKSLVAYWDGPRKGRRGISAKLNFASGLPFL